MGKDEIYIDDIDRILFGQAPPEFLLEVFIRTIIIYTGTLVVAKVMGKRVKAQLTITEMAVMIMMGAVISLPMQVPSRGVLQGFAILITLTLMHFYFNWQTTRSRTFEKLTQGEMAVLIRDGILLLPEMEKAKLSREQVFAELRSRKIFNLAEVKRMYIEDCGSFSIYKEDSPGAGLPTFPAKDISLHTERGGGKKAACESCGTVMEVRMERCINCNSEKVTTL